MNRLHQAIRDEHINVDSDDLATAIKLVKEAEHRATQCSGRCFTLHPAPDRHAHQPESSAEAKRNVWVCWFDADDNSYHDGTFEEVQRTQTSLTLRLLEPGTFSHYPNITAREIPTPGAETTKFCSRVHWHGDYKVVVTHEPGHLSFVYQLA